MYAVLLLNFVISCVQCSLVLSVMSYPISQRGVHSLQIKIWPDIIGQCKILGKSCPTPPLNKDWHQVFTLSNMLAQKNYWWAVSHNLALIHIMFPASITPLTPAGAVCHWVPWIPFLFKMNQLNDDNEKLQKQVTAKDGGQDSGAEAEIRRLRAENAALQKSLTSKSLSTSFNNLSK